MRVYRPWRQMRDAGDDVFELDRRAKRGRRESIPPQAGQRPTQPPTPNPPPIFNATTHNANCALESILTVRFLIDSTILPSNLQHNVWRLACHDGAVDWVRDLRRRTIWP